MLVTELITVNPSPKISYFALLAAMCFFECMVREVARFVSILSY